MKIIHTYIAWLLAGMILVLPCAVKAQNPGNGGTTFAGMQTTTRPEEFLGKFIELAQADGALQATLLRAIGDIEGAQQVTTASAELDINSTPAQITAATNAARSARQRVSESLETRPQLRNVSDVDFSVSVLRLAQTAHEFIALTKNIQATKQILAMAGSPAKTALYTARAAPDITAQIRSELDALVAYARAKNVALSPEVLKAFAEMQ
jgi:hypothetical protein